MQTCQKCNHFCCLLLAAIIIGNVDTFACVFKHFIIVFFQEIESLRFRQSSCEEDLRLKETRIETMKNEERALQDKVMACQTTCANPSNNNCQSFKDLVRERKNICEFRDLELHL